MPANGVTEKIEDKLLGKPKTANYRPAVSIGVPAWAAPTGWGYFSLGIVDEMRKDWQVSQALAFKQAPLYTAEFEFKASSPEVQRYAEETVDRFWNKSLGYALECMPFGYSTAEPLYKDEGGVIKFDVLKPVHPRDAEPWVNEGTLAYVKVQTHGQMAGNDEGAGGKIVLEAARRNVPAKGYWNVFEPKYVPWYGRPVLMPSWWPWRIKVMPDGAMESAFKAFYKHAFMGMVVRHPDETYQDELNGPNLSAQDYARQMGEQIKAGANIALSSRRDESGNYAWTIEQYGGKAEGEFQHLMEYPDWLDRLIVRGMGIPDEIISHDGNTGGYSRSNISWLAFIIMEEEVLNHQVHTFKDQILDPLIRLNYGAGAWCQIKPKPLLMQQVQDAAQGSQQPPGQAQGAQLPGQTDQANPDFTGPRGGRGHIDPDTGKKVYESGSDFSALDFAQSEWQPYTGPRGGKGWRSTRTSRVLYQAERPGEEEHEGESHDEGTPEAESAAKLAALRQKFDAARTAHAADADNPILKRARSRAANAHQKAFFAHQKLVAQGKQTVAPTPASESIKLSDTPRLLQGIAAAAIALPNAIRGNKADPQAGEWEAHKVPIADLYDAMKPRLGDATLDQFKQALLDANGKGALRLSRLDMPDKLYPGDPERSFKANQRSEIKYGNATFNLVTLTPKELRKGLERVDMAYAPAAPHIDPQTVTRSTLPRGKYLVRLIDAAAFRSHCQACEEFGLWAAHADFPFAIPADEIWMDANASPDDREHFLTNAVAYCAALESGLTKDAAYEEGLAVERAARENDAGLAPTHDGIPGGVYVKLWKAVTEGDESIAVWVVNGAAVRDVFKTDFTQGGNPSEYPWIPADEIWIEDTLDESERPFVLLHELTERQLMRQGLGYDKAHEIASRKEFQARTRADARDLSATPEAVAFYRQLKEELSSLDFARFDESKHPRGQPENKGEFASKASGPFQGGTPVAAKRPAERGEMVAAKREGKGKDARIVLADGSAAPAHIKPAMIPPAWKQVQISPDSEADVLITGIDAKGRRKTVYHERYMANNQAAKFAKIKEGLDKFDQIAAQNQANLSSADAAVREAAAVVWLMQEQATRPGSEADTKGHADLYGRPLAAANVKVTPSKTAKGRPSVALEFDGRTIPVRDDGTKQQLIDRLRSGEGLYDSTYWLKSHGATSLEGRHVVDAPDGVRLQFVGKEGVWHDHKIRDPKLAAELLKRKRAAGNAGKLFDTDYARVAAYSKTLDGGRFTPKDFRTMRATSLAIEAIHRQKDCCPDPATYKQRVMAVATEVAGVLGNRPEQTLLSYIAPEVWSAWRTPTQ